LQAWRTRLGRAPESSRFSLKRWNVSVFDGKTRFKTTGYALHHAVMKLRRYGPQRVSTRRSATYGFAKTAKNGEYGNNQTGGVARGGANGGGPFDPPP
jgi:hypothetical protein